MRGFLFLAAASLGAAGLTLQAAGFPRPAPAMTFQKPGGGVIDLKQYRGKVVVLEFLLTGCPHCQHCSQILRKLQTEYAPRGFQAVGVAVNDITLVPRFVMDHQLQYPVGFAPGESARDFLQHPPAENLLFPQTVFIDRRGMIRSQHMGCKEDEEKDMRVKIEELLKTTPPSAPRRVVAPKAKAAAPTAPKR